LLAVCFLAMGAGLFLRKRSLRKGCSLNPDDPSSTCACKEASQKPSLDESDPLIQLHPKIKK